MGSSTFVCMYAVVSMCDFLGKLFSIGIQKWIYHKIIHNLGTWEMGLYGFVVLLLLILELIKTEGWMVVVLPAATPYPESTHGDADEWRLRIC